MEKSVFPVILAGGSGTRLWPLSRELYPKQFISLIGELSTFQLACKRASVISDKKPLIICNEEHRFIVAEQLRLLDMEAEAIILEPVGRDTAPAVALAAIYAEQNFDNSLLVILSADHYIPEDGEFRQAADAAVECADTSDKLVIFGIEPTAPETGFGYIKVGDKLTVNSFKVEEFKEKPTEQVAIEYLKHGSYLWNSGMFIFKASVYLNELKLYEASIFEYSSEAMSHGKSDGGFFRPSTELFLNCSSMSIDYAVIEKTSNAVVIPLSIDWADLGSWPSLLDISEKDGCGNAIYGDVIIDKTKSTYIHSQEKLTVAIGVEDLVIVDTKDALLILNKEEAQNVKPIISKIKSQSPNLVKHHRHVYRPWGAYDSIDSGYRYQVKRIEVKPKEKLSLQMHHHRAEHWIVVKGTAKVTVGESEQLVCENESVYIPLGEIHCLENPGQIPLELIEVQSGSYLGEDDIVRLKDNYGRV